MNESSKNLSSTDPSERILLLSYCLRPSQTCPGKFNKSGLVCPEDCGESCVIRRLKGTALALGYKGVCVAAGGAMALKFVAENHPKAIVAVACDKELAEGVEGVRTMAKNGNTVPSVIAIPLAKNGCVDTEVDEEMAQAALANGYVPESVIPKVFSFIRRASKLGRIRLLEWWFERWRVS